jgi:hypothetical protein
MKCSTCGKDVVFGELFHSEKWEEFGPIEHEQDFGWIGLTVGRIHHTRCLPGYVKRELLGITTITGAARLGVQEVK